MRQPVLWIHAVSLGETRAAVPLVERAAARISGGDGAPHAHDGDGPRGGTRRCSAIACVQAWLPYDVPFAVRAFLAHWQAARRPHHGNRAVAESRRARARGRRAALSRQRAAVRALGRRLRTRRLARRGRCSRRSPASRRRPTADAARLAALGAPRAGRHRQSQVRPASRRPTRRRSGRELRARFGDGAPGLASPRRRATARRR